jgi:small GTP-binding protein
MPTNLPAEALEAERRFRSATSGPERIEALEEYISLIPKHKGTDKLRADLRKQLSKLKSTPKGKKGAARHRSPFAIRKEGAGQVVLVGWTNVGKSSLVTALTNASPEVSSTPFTTWTPTPGMMNAGGVQIQLIDTPPLTTEYVEPEMYNLIRGADLLLLVLDLHADAFRQLEDVIRILQDNRIVPQHLKDEYSGERRATFTPVLLLINKNDDEATDEDVEIFLELLEGDWPVLPVSAQTGRNLDALRQLVLQRLELIRVYAKSPGADADLNTPFALKEGSAVEDFAVAVHRDFFENLKAARVWGHGVHDGQLVQRDHVLHDGDVVELRI